ncbi:hypothetical protein Pan216_49990 [Planctomycetes bacterium Pan216]|uniref:Calcium-binding protein n=1 Tax=Kolteria novifilia TaxID=2527975 RepID=A0A518BAU7_9BACT|nr:hypothetical protein Pan216_49990 [Planctomycetes bacterium Pan216]
MRLLFAIPHFYDPEGNRRHASANEHRARRAETVRTSLSSLRQTFTASQGTIDIAERKFVPINTASSVEADLVVCTTRGKHLLEDLALPAKCFTHHATDAEPMYLGYECHAVLRDRLGDYDYYCFLEDDLILSDPWFFLKLAFFNECAGPECLLQPNRFEVSMTGAVRKAYIDGDLALPATERFQNISERSTLDGKLLGRPVKFQRPRNPHSGCFFLTKNQLEHWASQPYFLDRSAAFIGPLESAATLGIMRAFRIYKTSPAAADFLEILHHRSAFLGLIGRQISVSI